jgi:hypothetical protein
MQFDGVKFSLPVPSTISSTSIGRSEDMIVPSREDPRYFVDLRILLKSE